MMATRSNLDGQNWWRLIYSRSDRREEHELCGVVKINCFKNLRSQNSFSGSYDWKSKVCGGACVLVGIGAPDSLGWAGAGTTVQVADLRPRKYHELTTESRKEL